MTPPSIDPTILHVTDGAVELVAARCPACAAMTLPARTDCDRCGEQTEPAAVPTTGTVRSHCSLSIPVPGAEQPVVVAEVHLVPQLVVQGVIDGPVEIGDVVDLVPRLLEVDDTVYTSYGFARRTHG